MMERRLRGYLSWKGGLGKISPGASTGRNTGSTSAGASTPAIRDFGSTSVESSSSAPRTSTSAVSEALRKKDEERRRRSMNRRRIRGGAPGTGTVKREGTPALNGSGSSAAIDAQVETETEMVGGMSGKEREKLGLLIGEGEMRREVESVRSL